MMMPGADPDPYSSLINQILSAMLPQLNQDIGPQIRQAGWDPSGNLVSGSQDFGIGTLHYSLGGLSGLSSLQLNSLSVSALDASNPGYLTGTMNFAGSFSSNISATVGADFKIWFVDPSVSIALTLKSCSISGSMNFHADIGAVILKLDQVSNGAASISYGDSSYDISGLGPFDSLADTIGDAMMGLLKGQIQSEVSAAASMVVSQAVSGILPQSVPL
ncbi:hypothetical protein V8J88_09060 [Massilia sp. W12]|uniref:hypothetical protein n=1 Tax=Massilia sp. W12 TaxID=3126507 RepID=UPI0030CCC3E5